MTKRECLTESDFVVARNTEIVDQVVFVDGLSGTGKTMMGPILSSLDRMEVQRFDHIHEYICAMRFLERIEDDAAIYMVKLYADLACYNAMIGRESNFRWKDLSGVLSNPHGWRYFARLFQSDGESVMDRIKATRPILQVHSHQILGISGPLFSALGKRLTIVEMVRHPLYLISHWYSCIDRLAVDPREFTIWLNYNNTTLPWFTKGWEAEYVNSNKMDKVILLIEWLMGLSDDYLEGMCDQAQEQVLIIPFERFVIEPWPYVDQIATALGTNVTRATKRSMKKQKVPRKVTTDGRDLEIYRRYNWYLPPKGSTEGSEMQRRWDFVSREATQNRMDLLRMISDRYETRYLNAGK